MRRHARVGFVIVALAGCGPGSPAQDETAGATTGSSGSDSTTGEADGGDTETGEPETSDTETSDTETGDTETGDTEEACVPGTLDCECLPDGSCSDEPYFLGCTDGGTCQGCGFERSIVSPPCSPGDCPTDCVIVLSEYGIGPLEEYTVPFVSIRNALDELPYVGDACATESGWTWVVVAEQLELCGEHCDAWMDPALEGTGYDIEFGCPPGG